jgi:hypothetical protein
MSCSTIPPRKAEPDANYCTESAHTPSTALAAMARADFEERAAILEFDQGMTRAAAESRALREICDLRLAEGFPGILGELAQAARRRTHPDLAPLISDLGLASVRGPAWGFGHVVADGETYQPAIDGETARAAFIVPAIEDGAVADLVACSVETRRMRSRHGAAALVGFDEIDRAREADAPLLVFDNAIRWLRGNTRGAVIVDWKRAVGELEGVEILMCSASLAPRLHDATRRCWPRPTIAFAQPEKMRHAA